MEEERDFEKDWEEFWKDILLDDNGNINLEQLKKELSDYRMIIDSTSEIVEEITCGTLSYPNYPARTVLNIFEDKFIEKQIAGEDMLGLVKDSGDLEEIESEIREYFNLGED